MTNDYGLTSVIDLLRVHAHFRDFTLPAPFPSNLSYVSAITQIIRQGRCTLTATVQMYKILTLNCLITAWGLSVQYPDGNKAKPVEKLPKERPLGNIFNFYVLLSVLLQFALHTAMMVYITNPAGIYEPRTGPIDLEAKFEPSLLNTAIYLLGPSQQSSCRMDEHTSTYFKDSDNHTFSDSDGSPRCPASPQKMRDENTSAVSLFRCPSADDLHQRLLIAKLQQTVRRQERRLNYLASQLRAIKSEVLEALDGCADDSDSDVGTATPPGDWSHSNAIAISTAFFAEISVCSEVAAEADVPTSIDDHSAVALSEVGSTRTVANPRRVRRTRGRMLRREGARIFESLDDLIEP
ncbi:hypothetical protein HYPSUDRAFT_208190 [Hypholoma sublateritium FD-334 SS-4]|uniref:DUF1746 domain-containing protein n=1 Tax=Hypholoma sublateritium (strain FD-334 SS-4) TaxID=945553 RepID=A0A0D2NEG1_HYPSF|nr:hypothetical protein HYPSUDRAFT_208190 [Hypholoma sublateritium FD-334 SS-4]